MAFSPRLSILVLLLAYAALLEPARASSSATAPPPCCPTGGDAVQPAGDLDSRLDRISRALRDRFAAGSIPTHLDGAVARGFVNGPRGGFVNAPYRGGFANAHPYYGGPVRSFVNSRGGYYGGGFANARPRGGRFVNW